TESHAVEQQYASWAQIFVAHGSQVLESFVPAAQIGCAHVPPPSLPASLPVSPPESVPVSLPASPPPPPPRSAPLGVPQPVGPSTPTLPVQRYEPPHDPLLPVVTSKKAPVWV